MIKWPNIGLFGDFEPCEAGVLDALNKNFFLIDVLMQLGALDSVATLPSSPATGDIYILSTDKSINAWDGDVWIKFPARVGMIAYLEDESEFYWYNGTTWVLLPKTLGDVLGPATSVDNRIARYDGTAGKLIQNSLVSISDTGVMAGAIQTITDLLTALTVNTVLTETDLVSAKYAAETTLTGAVTLATPTTAVVKIQSAITQINNITAPTVTGNYNRLHIIVNEKTSGDIVISESGNIKTGLSADLTLKNGASAWFMYDKALNIWRVVGGSGGGSGSGEINFITNGDAENASSTIFTPYLTGITTSVSTTTPLSGKKSFLYTKAVGDTFTNAGAYIPFIVDKAYRAKMCKISFDYIVNSGTFRPDLDVKVRIYDETNAVYIEPSNFKLSASSTDLSTKFEADFQTSFSGVNYRLDLQYIGNLNQAFELKLDNIKVAPSQYVYAPIVTDWKSDGAITITGATTNPTKGSINVDKMWWRRVGDNAEIRMEYEQGAAGTAGSGDYFFKLPANLQADLTKVTAFTLATPQVSFNCLGTAFAGINGSATGSGAVVLFDATRFRMAMDITTSSTAFSFAGSGYFSLANGAQQFTASFTVPIAGWTSNNQVSDGFDARDLTFSGTQTTQAVTANVTNIAFTATKDSAASWNGTQYVVKSAGDYLLTGSGRMSALGTLIGYKNGTSLGSFSTAAAATHASSGSILFSNCVAGDVLSLRSDVSITVSAGNISISKNQAPTTISATEDTFADYGSTAGNTIGTSNTLQIFATKIDDSHGLYNASTGIFTANRRLRIKVSAAIKTAAVNLTTAQEITMSVFKNGTFYRQIAAEVGTGVSAPKTLVGSCNVFLNAGETLSVQAQSAVATTQSTTAGFNYITIEGMK